MTESLLSQSWYRVAQLKPRLRSHATILRQQYRGETWYVLQDRSSERFHRFSPAAYKIIGLMEGTRSVEDIWNIALHQLGDDAPSQDEVIQLLGQLHGADVLQCDVPPDTQEIFRRRTRVAQTRLRKRLLNVFAWQIPLFDPEKLLNVMLPLVRPFAGSLGLMLWCGVVGAAAVLGWAHWSELSENALDKLLAPGNLVVLWLLFPLVKLLHEFGHAFAVKIYGGEVHEMGMMLLVFSPSPYVDASAAWGFRSKWQRIMVGSAGMAVELFIASIALFLWLAVEPGIVRSLCYNTILIAGISTVLFNANPLLRFDGYYMLMDYVEIPNLHTRSTKYLTYLCERYLFSRREAKLQTAGRGERIWFVGFAIASFAYRLLVIFAILFYVGAQHLLLGLIFAASTAFAWLVMPAYRIGKYLFNDQGIRKVRRRAITATVMIVGGVCLILLALPMPFRTVVEGVVWVQDEGVVYAGADGFVVRVVAQPGSRVEPGQVLIECDDPDLRTESQVLEAQLRELDAMYRQVNVSDRVRAEIIQEKRRYAAETLNQTQQRLAELTLRSRVAGKFVMPGAADLPGRYVRKGETIGHVVDEGRLTLRAVVPQEDIDLVRESSAQVEVRLAERMIETVPAVVRRVVPSASNQLPSAALGQSGGGALAVDPSDTKGLRAIQRFFEIEIALPSEIRAAKFGGRSYVRLDHGWKPLGIQWYRHMRQLFLSRLNV